MVGRGQLRNEAGDWRLGSGVGGGQGMKPQGRAGGDKAVSRKQRWTQQVRRPQRALRGRESWEEEMRRMTLCL